MSTLRPHQRRALQGQSQDPDPKDPIIAMPVVGLLELLEEQFPDSTRLLGGTAEEVYGQVCRIHGNQEVIQFIRNLEDQRKGAA